MIGDRKYHHKLNKNSSTCTVDSKNIIKVQLGNYCHYRNKLR